MVKLSTLYAHTSHKVLCRGNAHSQKPKCKSWRFEHTPNKKRLLSLSSLNNITLCTLLESLNQREADMYPTKSHLRYTMRSLSFDYIMHHQNSTSIICRVCKPQYAAINKKTPKNLPQKENIWYILFMFPLETKTSCTTHLDSLRKKYRGQFAIYLTKRFFLTDTFICSFNNKALEKCTSGKALNSVTTVCFFATLIPEQPADLWCF